MSDEEIGSRMLLALTESEVRRVKIVLVWEPSRDGGCCVIERKGAAQFEIKFTGVAAHAGPRHMHGRSAIKEMARQILNLEAMTEYNKSVTMNVGTVSGGTRTYVVSYEAFTEVDTGVPNTEIAETVVATVMAPKPYDPDVTITVKGDLTRPPYEKRAEFVALYDTAARCRCPASNWLWTMPFICFS